MKRKKAPRLAAAFVMTISAGCGGASQEPATPEQPETTNQPETTPPDPKKPDDQSWVPNLGSVKEGFRRNPDGTCTITHAANPPWVEPVDCETQAPLKKPEEKTP